MSLVAVALSVRLVAATHRCLSVEPTQNGCTQSRRWRRSAPVVMIARTPLIKGIAQLSIKTLAVSGVGGITAALLYTGAAIAADPPPQPLPFTSMSPANGAVITAGSPVTFTVTGAPHGANLYLEVATQNIPGQDGSLADDFRQDFEILKESDAYPGTYTATAQVVSGVALWNMTPGTYYWQVSGNYLDRSSYPPTYDHLIGPVLKLTVSAPPPQPPTQTHQDMGPDQEPDLAMSSADARYYALSMIKKRTHHSPRRLRVSCHRLSFKSYRCTMSWSDSKNSYGGTGTFTHYPAGASVYTMYRFRGWKTSVRCVRKHKSTHCTKIVRWG